MNQTGRSFRIWFLLPAVLLAVILFAGGILFWRARHIAEGSVIKEPENRGHTIVVNFGAPNARIQDIPSLAVDSDKPFLTGTVKIKGKLVVPPSHTKALEKLILDGEFGLGDA